MFTMIMIFQTKNWHSLGFTSGSDFSRDTNEDLIILVISGSTIKLATITSEQSRRKPHANIRGGHHRHEIYIYFFACFAW